MTASDTVKLETQNFLKGNNIPSKHDGIDYMQFMEKISQLRNSRRYLEIGVRHGDLLSHIHTNTAVAVDPALDIKTNISKNKKLTLLVQETSDSFFANYVYSILAGGKPDLIFLDGMHTVEYLLRDLYNAESICSDESLIVMHDCLPLNAEMAHRDMKKSIEIGKDSKFPWHWTGDVWKIIPILQQYRSDLQITYVDCSPTGLVCISNVASSSTVLRDNYFNIVSKCRSIPNNLDGINSMYESISITPAEEILLNWDNTQFFKI